TVNDLLFFSADDGVHPGCNLWKTDGTPGGTVPVFIDPDFGLYPSFLTAVAGEVFFVAPEPGTGRPGLWKSDGTATGTLRVMDFPAPPGPMGLMALDGRLVFRANDGLHGNEVWVSDGTASGTFQIKDVRPGPDGS